MNFYSEKAFRVVFYGCLVMMAFCLACAILSVSLSNQGYGSTFINKISGTGAFEQRTNMGGATDIASGVGTYSYSLTATWDDGTPLKFSSALNMKAVGESVGRLVSNVYSVLVYSDATGYKHAIEARKISGNFTGKADFVKSETSLDSMIFVEGNATFRGSLVNSMTGRHPTTESDTYAVGMQVIEQYFNTTAEIKNEEGWLEFCADWNGLSPAPPEGIYIVPDGYVLVGGKLVRQNRTAIS